MCWRALLLLTVHGMVGCVVVVVVMVVVDVVGVRFGIVVMCDADVNNRGMVAVVVVFVSSLLWL